MARPDKKKSPPKDGMAAPTPRSMRTLMIWWGVFLIALFIVMARVVPVGGDGPTFFKVRRDKKAISRAESMERDGLWHAAAEAYEKIAQDEAGDATLRSSASERLAMIYSEKLDQPDKAEVAKERAYFLQPDPMKKASLKPGSAAKERAKAKEADGPKFALPEGTTTIAKIGDADVTMEEILYAWSRIHSDKEPTAKDLQPFIQEYLDNVLLSEEARRRGDDESTEQLLGMRFIERQMLARGVTRTLMPKADRAAVEKFYQERGGDWMREAAFRAAHIVVRQQADSDEVAKRLAAGEDFKAVAKTASLDQKQLPEGSDLGWIGASEQFIPHVGAMPSLAAKLAARDDGYTTGPLPTARGFEWIKVVEKRPAAPAPLDEVYKEVETRYLKETYARAKEDLLKKLKGELKIEAYGDRLKEAISKLTAPPAPKPEAEFPKPAATPAATPAKPQEPLPAPIAPAESGPKSD